MPRISHPYYNLSQIITGKYSGSDEFVLKDGSIYIGPYHILPGNRYFTGFQPEDNSFEIFEKRLNPTQDILRYNQITGNEINRYNPPISFQPNPNSDDYKRGKIQRFFVQKRNSQLNTILEIDYQQYNSINTQNNPGINGVTWNSVLIDWIISKIPSNDALTLNQLQVQKNLPNFPYLNTILTNYLEFYR